MDIHGLAFDKESGGWNSRRTALSSVVTAWTDTSRVENEWVIASVCSIPRFWWISLIVARSTLLVFDQLPESSKISVICSRRREAESQYFRIAPFFRSYVPLIVPLAKQDVCLLWAPLSCWTSLPEFQRLVCCGVCAKVPNLKTNLMFEVEAGTEW